MSMLLSTAKHGEVHQRLASELAKVEALFAAELVSDIEPVNRLVNHIEKYRGKMLRPTLLLVSAMACGPVHPADAPEISAGKVVGPGHHHRVVATVAEMVHMATLVHDDILDEAQVRRGGATVNELEGNEIAVMLGDYLISHAYHLCSSLDDQHVSRLIANTTNTVCEGELLQLANRHNWLLDEATYDKIIDRKTASLCGMCCQIAGYLHQVDPTVLDALHRYGRSVGMAFQIVDDLLDLIGSENTVGKSLVRDLQKGKPTLPMIHHLNVCDAKVRRQVLDLLPKAGDLTGTTDVAMHDPIAPDNVVKLRQWIISTGSVEYAQQRAANLVGDAKQALAVLAETPARALLMEMADAVITRDF